MLIGVSFDTRLFLAQLDELFAAHAGPERAEAFLRDALEQASDDPAAQLTVLNELMGHLRSMSDHDGAVAAAEQSLALAAELSLDGSDAHTTVLINAATAYRAAGDLARAAGLYTEALDAAETTLGPRDRRRAALRNNRSLLLSEIGDHEGALADQRAALDALEAATVDPERDVDIASTCTNMALELWSLGRHEEAAALASRSLAVFAAGGHEDSPHYASALAGQAEALFRRGDPGAAADLYERALAVIQECYGTGSDAYAVTAENLARAREATAGAGPASASAPNSPCDGSPDERTEPSEPAHGMTGLEIARAFWEQQGRPMLLERFPEHAGRIAAGLVGHGSECYGFDDAASRDHDWGPGFCLWLTPADHAEIGSALQEAYDDLPQDFMGLGPRVETPRAQGAGRRVGVFEIGAFFASITGMPAAPGPDRAREWLLLDEATLAAATNGEVFADPLGAFGKARSSFRRMPDDVWRSLISRRLGMAAQAGQYNVARMLDRGDGEAAWLSIGEFVSAVSSLVFLLNRPATVGYLPYYKWRFAALRRLSSRPGSRLPHLVTPLTDLVRLASAACAGGVGFGEGGAGSAPARARVEALIESICVAIVDELGVQGLSDSREPFLEWQRPHVERGIVEASLRSIGGTP